MENSQTSSLHKKSKYKRAADSIHGLITGLNYEFYSSVELEALILLTNHIRVIPSEEISGFRITKYTEAWSIFKRLKDAYSERKVEEIIKDLLLEYEHYEILKEIEF